MYTNIFGSFTTVHRRHHNVGHRARHNVEREGGDGGGRALPGPPARLPHRLGKHDGAGQAQEQALPDQLWRRPHVDRDVSESGLDDSEIQVQSLLRRFS